MCNKADCNCCQASSRFTLHLKAKDIRRVEYEGKDTIIVPVIMARGDVVMNGGLVPESEFEPFAWNGVPVTLNHPAMDSVHTSANTPETLAEYSIGRIFNSTVRGKALRGEAWLDVERSEKIAPGLVEKILAGINIDVSTGFFCDEEEVSGEVGGREYTAIRKNIRPDHLAFLPDDAGACSWNDGCGVRANKGTSMKLKISEAFTTAVDALKTALLAFQSAAAGEIIETHERGAADDRTMMCADLMSSDDTPFLPEDKYALESMSLETLKKLRDKYVKQPSANVADQAQETAEVKPEDLKAAIAAAMAEVVPAMVANAVATALKTNSMSDDDKSAIAHARRVADEHKASLISKVVANSKITKEQAAAMPVDTLEVIVNGLPSLPVATYAGRALPETQGDDEEAKGMAAPSVVTYLQERAKKKEAA